MSSRVGNYSTYSHINPVVRQYNDRLLFTLVCFHGYKNLKHMSARRNQVFSFFLFFVWKKYCSPVTKKQLLNSEVLVLEFTPKTKFFIHQ